MKLGSNIIIREMQNEDILTVQSLWISVGFEKCYSDQFDEVKRMITRNPELCLVLIKEQNIIGAVMGGFDGRRGWIHHLAIHPEHQKQGMGNLLMTELTNRFDRMGVVKLKLEILESNSSVINFYKSIGWNLRSELTTMSLTLKRL